MTKSNDVENKLKTKLEALNKEYNKITEELESIGFKKLEAFYKQNYKKLLGKYCKNVCDENNSSPSNAYHFITNIELDKSENAIIMDFNVISASDFANVNGTFDVKTSYNERIYFYGNDNGMWRLNMIKLVDEKEIMSTYTNFLKNVVDKYCSWNKSLMRK